MTDLNKIETIVIVMMENRSFDHMLGYLSLPDYGRTDVEGLRYKANVSPPVWDFEYVVPGPYTPFRMPDPKAPLPNNMDPPHERRPYVEKQMGVPDADNIYPMNGFVQSYDAKINVNGVDQPVVMGYFTGEDLPTTHFFAENFLICDHWFSSIPAGTQPNRLIAMGGQSRIDMNVNKPPLPDQFLVYHWLRDHGVRWRVYAESLPFFALMPNEWPLLSGNLQFFSHLAHDIVHEDSATFPQVIFVEPRYTNAPHVDSPHDDHAPSAVDGGQRFLMQVYAALTANPERWKKSVMIVTYDEHGGFFDHISPPHIETADPDGVYPTFKSLGVRVPSYVISPFVERRTAYHETMDHTSILKFLGEKFNGGSYSAAVDARVDLGLESVAATLTLDEARVDIPSPPATTEGFTTEGVPFDAMSQAFAGALAQLKANHPADIAKLFPKLFAHF